MANKTKQSVSVSAPLVIVLMLAIAAAGGFWWYASQPREPARPKPTTEEAKAYTKNLKLSEVKMKASVSYAGGDLVEIVGKIQNAGDRAVTRAELTCIFYDPFGTEVARERLPIVKAKLKPGDTREFRLPFEGIPPQWNQAMPSMVIASIEFP
ncbi:MAG: FxLYD domain-containing protein [Bryobacteraceae bacterium]|nr:FxLYD domain-containing protein [Bryobacteraceae bacterium]